MIALIRYGKRILMTMVVFGAVLALGACASSPELSVQPVSVLQDPTAAVARLESKIAEARQNQLNVLSPVWFAKAEGSLAEVKKVQGSKGDISRIAQAASRGLTEIKQAEVVGGLARTNIPDAIEGRKLARTAGATSFGEDYAAVERQFLVLTRSVESNELAKAKKGEANVVKAFHALEIRAIKNTILGDTRKVLEKADREGARKWTPELFADAQKELSGVEAYIASNPYAREEMQLRGNVALFKANRVLQVNRQAALIREAKPLDTTLWIEGILKKASDALEAPDMRDQSFDTQVGNILGSIDALLKDRDFLVQKTADQQEAMDNMASTHLEEMEVLKRNNKEQAAKLALLLDEQQAEQARLEAERLAEKERLEKQKRAAEERLEAERRFNELYNKVQALFKKDEAECYKQGNRMVIRLRGMTFPVGQSVIMPENYPLLSKVRTAVRTFTEPRVTIEGHTDSTGTAEFNDHLSQQRAESVQEYLLANNVLRVDQVAAAGYGSSRPLAPNTTAEGRAANRRIDLVITPRDLPAM